MNNTDSSDNTQEVAQSINTIETIKEVAHEENQAPLMRYFSIADESTESYVLGYN